MHRNNKRGFSTALATAILSITAAGILSSQDYSAMFANNTTVSQVKNVSILVDSVVKRLRHDGKKAWKILDVDRLPSDGSVWSKNETNTHNCTTLTACGGIFNDTTPVEFTISEIRRITTG